jgi:hypothetical protein
MPLSRIGLSQNQQVTGNVTFTGTGNRIRGDFSSGTLANRVLFQASTTNASTTVGLITNGTGASSQLALYGSSDPTNAAWLQIAANANSGTEHRIAGTQTGTGSYLPITMFAGGSERLRIDTSGNVGIGTSSPTQKLDISGNAAITGTGYLSLQRPIIPVTNQGTPQLAFQFYTTGTTYTTGAQIQAAAAGTWTSTSAPTNMLFYTCPSASTTIEERMRITAAGAVYIGDTTGSTRFYVTNDNRVAMFNATNTTVGTEVIVQSNLISSNNATSADYLFIGGVSGGSDRVYILGNGNLQNINNSYGTLSDIKLKENIVDATSKLDDVMQLKVRNFNLKSDPTQKQIGFVAQELETVFPSMIEEISELDEDKKFTGNKVKGIKTTVLIPILVKAIQEQQAIIASLTSRIESLENQ